MSHTPHQQQQNEDTRTSKPVVRARVGVHPSAPDPPHSAQMVQGPQNPRNLTKAGRRAKRCFSSSFFLSVEVFWEETGDLWGAKITQSRPHGCPLRNLAHPKEATGHPGFSCIQTCPQESSLQLQHRGLTL